MNSANSEFRIKFGDKPWTPWKPVYSHYHESDVLESWGREPEGKPILAVKTGTTVRQWRLL